MQNAGKNRKPLIIGMIAAIVLLAAVAALVLTQFTGSNAGATTPISTTVETEPVLEYDLYWNADREMYDGMTEAGLSSRQPESDGFFHIRFILDGEEVILKTADRKLVNSIDVRTLMGLEVDENGIITGFIDILDMPIVRAGWMFYVQSAAKNVIKLNSAENLMGLEVLLELTENTGVYDMSGETGPLGTKTEAIAKDRVYAIANLAGEITHVFIYQRPNYMLSHEGECEHCKKTVTWYEWTKEDQMPVATGHYQLQNDVKLAKQPKEEEDAKVCIDLNGHRVDAADATRCYALFNAGAELAIMDTSEGQTGVMASHGAGGEGMVVWVRYGEFYFYGGTLDGSDTVSTGNGVTVATRGNTYFYMYGGTIIGGVADPTKKEDGSWTAGLGGTIALGGKFVMNDGEIRGGRANAVITARDTSGVPTGYSRGMGGNIMMGGGSEMIMNGGLITGGRSGGNGGNIYMDARASLTVNGGTIQLGRAQGNGRSGGNIYVGNKATLTLSGGKIINGTSYSVGGNIRCKGTFTMNSGYVAGGSVYDWVTGKKVEDSAGANVRIQDGYMNMYGGTIKGGVNVVDTSKTDGIKVRLRLSGLSVIDGGEDCTRNLSLGSGGDGVIVNVGKLHEKASVGVHTTTGYFTEPTEEDNARGIFFSDIEGAEVVYHDGKLALGQLACVCGSDAHFGQCDGQIQLWTPWTNATSLPKSTGYWYLLADLPELPKQTNVTNEEPQQVYLNLNGHSATVSTGTGRVYRLNGENQLVITDHVGTGGLYSAGMSKDVGAVIFQQDKTSLFQLYGGTLAMLADSVTDTSSGGVIRTSGTFDMFGGTISGGKAVEGGNITLYTGSTMNLYGGTVQGGTSGDGTASSHSNIYVYNANFNMSGGTVYGIRATNTIENGCSINISGSAQILTGKSGHAFRMTVSGSDLTAEQRPAINLGELNEDAKITISGITGFVTTPTDEANTKHFASASNEVISYVDGKVYIGMQACICGSKTDTHIGDCDGTLHHWSAWTKTDSLPIESGYWYLIQDLTPDTLKKQSGIIGETAQQVYLNLNGFKATSAVRAYRVSGSNMLAITDHKGGGGLYGGGLSTDNGGVILQQNSTSVIKMYGGTLGMGANAVADTAQGGVLRTNGSFYLYAGTITGGKAVQGGNIHLHSGSNFYFYGGSVIGGTATGNGGNISIENGTLHLVKGTVSGGSAANGGNIHSNGTIAMTGGTVTGGEATTDGGNIYVNENSVNCEITGGTITGGTAGDCGGNLRVHKAKATISGITVSGGTAAMGNNLYQAGGAANVTLQNVKVNNTVSGSENIHVRAGKLTIDGSTEITTVDGSRNITTSDGGDGFIILKSGTITGAKFDGNGANIVVEARGELQIQGGTITGGEATGNGGNIYLAADGAEVFMTGGTIQGGVAANGGNIAMNGGSFNFYAGTAANGIASASGGNVYVFAGNLNVAPQTAESTATRTIGGGVAGSATSNAVVQGGNIYADRSAVVLLSGQGTLVCGGTTITSDWGPGGNIRVDGSADFKITSGAKVTGGDAADEGDNIYISRSGSRVTLDGAVIENTVASGSNVHAKAGVLTITGDAALTTVAGSRNIMTQDDGDVQINISGGTITGAKAALDGANIWISKLATLNVSGGTITGGEAEGKYGGNIYSNGGAVNVSDGTISGGKATQGGNIALNNTAASTISGGVISGGEAKHGGNLSVVKGALTANGGTVTGGSSETSGNNLYISGSASVVTLSGTKLENTSGANENILFRDGTLTLSGGSITTVDGARNINAENKGLIKVMGATITGKKVSGDGANIFLTGSAKLEISSGTVTGGEATGIGGNIFTESTEYVTISGGTVSGGKAQNGGNICVKGGTLNISGGTVSCGVTTLGGGNIYNDATVLMTGGNVIGGKAGTDGGNIYTNEKAVDCVITGGVISGGTATYAGGNLRAHKAKLSVSNATVSGGTAASGNNLYAAGGASRIRLNSATFDNTVASGANIHMRAGTLTIEGNSELKTVAGSRNICTDNDAQAIINLVSGTIRGAKTKADGANIWISTLASLNVSGGTIIGGDADGKNGGNIFTNGGTVTLTGGVVTGGDIYVALGKLAISGEAVVKNGGNTNITLANNSVLELSGGSVAGGIKLDSGVSVKLSGAPVVDPALTDSGTKPEFGIDLVNGDANIIADVQGLTGGSILVKGVLGQFAKNATETMATSFVSQNTEYKVEFEDGTLVLAEIVTIPQCVCGAPGGKHVSYTVGGSKVGCDGTELGKWTKYTGTELPTTAGNYRLNNDITVTEAKTLAEAVVLDLNGHTITVTGGRMYTMTTGAALTITNTVPTEGGIVVNISDTNAVTGAYVVEVATGTTLDLYNIEVTQVSDTTASVNGGLFLVGGTMNIFGSTEISGGKTSANGGNIYVGKSAVLNVYDGLVTAGSAANGGNIATEQGTVNLHGGAVTAGQASNGGNVWISKATLNAEKTTISGGSCTGHGNNVYTTGSASKVYLTGATVNNTVSNNEDNITYRAGTLEIKNATLTSVDDDYNIYCENTSANKAILLSNTTITGGGIYLTADKTIELNGTMPSGTKISVKYAVAVTDPVAIISGGSYTAKNWFTSADGYELAYVDGKIYLMAAGTHVHCICGGLYNGGTTFADGTTHTCNDVVFQALSVDGDENIITADTWLNTVVAADVNYWYLAESIQMETGKQIGNNNKNLYLCLHGNSLTGASDGRRLFGLGDASLVVTTCAPSASGAKANSLVATGSRNHNGGVVQMNGTSVVFEAYGVTLDASAFTLKDDGKHGAVIDASKGVVKLYNTTIKGGVNQAGKTSNGSVMRITANCDVYLYGGSIVGSQNINEGDADIYMQTGAELYLVGNVSITSKAGMPSILTEGTAKVDVTNLKSVASPMTVDAPGAFTKGWDSSKSIASYFVSAVDGKVVAVNADGELELVSAS